MISGMRILLGVSGGIAAYKAVDVLRRLRDQDAEVRVVMTRNATRFVTPLTFSALSGMPVLTDEFTEGAWGSMGHIAVTDGLDLALVVPATANIIGKMAAGIADDALSTSLMAAASPIIVAPAMNERMYRNAVLQRNIAGLRMVGIRFVEPETGALACGTNGQGRLASPERIVQEVVLPFAEVPGRGQSPGDCGPDTGADRCSAVHQQSFDREDGVCSGSCGAGPWCRGIARVRTDPATPSAGS